MALRGCTGAFRDGFGRPTSCVCANLPFLGRGESVGAVSALPTSCVCANLPFLGGGVPEGGGWRRNGRLTGGQPRASGPTSPFWHAPCDNGFGPANHGRPCQPRRFRQAMPQKGRDCLIAPRLRTSSHALTSHGIHPVDRTTPVACLDFASQGLSDDPLPGHQQFLEPRGGRRGHGQPNVQALRGPRGLESQLA